MIISSRAIGKDLAEEMVSFSPADTRRKGILRGAEAGVEKIALPV